MNDTNIPMTEIPGGLADWRLTCEYLGNTARVTINLVRTDNKEILDSQPVRIMTSRDYTDPKNIADLQNFIRENAESLLKSPRVRTAFEQCENDQRARFETAVEVIRDMPGAWHVEII